MALNAYVNRGTVTAACKKAGVARSTWYEWLESDEAFVKKVTDAYEQVTDEIEETALDKVRAGDTTMAIFMLKSRRRAIYGDKAEISGPGGGPITVAAKRIEDYESVIGRLAGGAPGPDPGEPVDTAQPDT